MNKQPAVSVIVPVYKAENYLHRCIDSLLAQTFTDFELLLVDDGSPDRSGEICDEYAAKDSRVRVFHKENGGVSSARNSALEYAEGDWIAFVDSDDWVDINYLDIFFFPLINIDLIHCGLKIEEKKGKFDRRLVFQDKKVITKKELFNRKYFSSCCVSYFYKKSILDIHKLRFCTSIKYSEDRQFIFKYISLLKNDILLINNQGYNYCLNPESVTHSLREYDRCLDDLIVLNSLNKLPIIHENNFVFRLLVKNYILSYCIFCHNRPNFNIAIKDLRYYTYSYKNKYWLYELFIKYPLLILILLKLYWKIRSIYYFIKW